MMEWVWLSLFSAAVCSAAVIVQKHCFTHHVKNTFTYGAWAALLHTCLALLLLYFYPLPQPWYHLPVLLPLLAGVVRALGLIAQYKGLQAEGEVSRAVPVIDSYPIFVAIFAVAFLGQSLTLTKWLAMALVVTGAVLISQHNLLPGQGIRLGKPFFYLLSSSLSIAVFIILIKLSLDELPLWHIYILATLSGTPVFLATALISGASTEIPSLPRRPQALGLVILAEVLLLVSIIVYFEALAIGPVSLIAALTATRPLIVLLYSTFLTVLLPRFLSEQVCCAGIMQKLLATSMVTAGVAIMSITQ